MRYLSKALRDLGHRVDVISGQPYPHLEDGVNLIKLPGLNLYESGLASVTWRDFLSWPNCVEWFSKLTGGFAEPYAFAYRAQHYLKICGRDYDIVHDNQCLGYGMLAIQKRMPFVTTIHHPITRDYRIALAASQSLTAQLLIKRWYSFLTMQRAVVRKLKHIVTVSQISRADIAKDFGIPATDIRVLYNGIDIETFAPQKHIQREPNLLLATASADAPMKGLSVLLNAYAQLIAEFPSLRLCIVGKAKENGDTEKLLRTLNIHHRVEFVSGIHTHELVELYARATLVVVPSIYEGFGLPAGEAMACGAPLISSNGGALPEVVGDAGMVVAAGDSAALRAAIKTLMSDAALREDYARRGRERIERKFCWRELAKSMSDYYREVIESHVNS